MTLTATQTTNNLQQFHDGFKAANYPVGTEGVLRKQDELQKKVDDALADLQTALSNGDSETLREYLAFLSRFHNYSFGNLMLIYLQNSKASHVAGFHKWKTLGRHVKKGETGIRILAPMVRGKKGETENSDALDDSAKNRHLFGFKAVSVFDVTQTEGKDLPAIGSYHGDPAENLSLLEAFTASKGINILWQQPENGALAASMNGTILVTPDFEPAKTFALLVHEVAHEFLHKGDRRAETTKTIRETEAEAVAFTVCSAVGLETGTAAADYIRLWQGDVENLRRSLEFVRVTSSEILTALTVEAAEPVAA